MKEFKLKHPFKSPVTGTEITKITIQRIPNVGDMRRLTDGSITQVNEVDMAAKLLTAIAELPPAEVDKISVPDFKLISEYLKDFLE